MYSETLNSQNLYPIYLKHVLRLGFLEPSKRPLNMLIRNLNNTVTIKLKNGVEYKGHMTQCDGYMNIILERATELHNSKPAATYGNVFIRGNNILYICVDESRK